MSKDEHLKKFLDKTDEVLNGNYLFASKKLEELIAVASQSQMLFELFEYCADGFDYELYKRKCARTGKPIPETPKEQLAYCFRLITDIATRRLDFNTFLQENFYVNNSLFDSYAEFLKQVIKPFRYLVKDTCESIIMRSDAKTVAEAISSDLDTRYFEGLIRLLNEDKVAVTGSLKPEQSKELVLLIDAFAQKAKDHDVEGVRTAYYGYKFAILPQKKLTTNYETITEMLTDHGVLK